MNEQAPTGPAWPGRILGLGGVLVVLVSLVVPVGGPITDPWRAGAWNLLHLPGFFLLTRSFLTLLGGPSGGPRLLLYSAALAFLAAFASEWVQMQVGRSGSIEDLILDGFGIALGLAWPVRNHRWSSTRKSVFGVVLLSGIVFAFGPALLQKRAEKKANGRLPVIGDFQDKHCLRLWKAQGGAAAKPDPENGALVVEVRPGAFGGVQYLPGEQDWSPYAELRLNVSNPGPPLFLGVRIDDHLSSTDRVWISAEAVIEEGESEIVIPMKSLPAREGRRPIDLSRVTRLVLFFEKVEKPVEFSIISAGLR
jgi:hypothetical protein